MTLGLKGLKEANLSQTNRYIYLPIVHLPSIYDKRLALAFFAVP